MSPPLSIPEIRSILSDGQHNAGVLRQAMMDACFNPVLGLEYVKQALPEGETLEREMHLRQMLIRHNHWTTVVPLCYGMNHVQIGQERKRAREEEMRLLGVKKLPVINGAFVGKSFEGVTFPEDANLERAYFEGSDISNCTIVGANMQATAVIGCSDEQNDKTVISGLTIQNPTSTNKLVVNGIHFKDCNLDFGEGEEAFLESCTFTNCKIHFADFKPALSNIEMHHCEISGNLQAVWDGGHFTNCVFKLSGEQVFYETIRFEECDFSEAKLDFIEATSGQSNLYIKCQSQENIRTIYPTGS